MPGEPKRDRHDLAGVALSGEQEADDNQLDLLLKLLLEVRGRTSQRTMALGRAREVLTFRDVTEAEASAFAPMPVDWPRRANCLQQPWRVILVSHDSAHEPLALALHGEIVIGRDTVGSDPVDLDMARFAGAEAGVSRRHALLRPTPESLLLLDLGSTNGTKHNGERVRLAVVHEVAHGDTLSIGRLHFQLNIISRPDSVGADKNSP